MHKITNANIKEWAANYQGEPFDAILCDPPYELGFMGKSWDSSGIAFDKEMWADLLRILKPGGHLLAFSGSGSEMIGALQAGWEYVEGVELTEEYIPIAEARIKYWLELKEAEQEQVALNV